jgi:hypothetical protein
MSLFDAMDAPTVTGFAPGLVVGRDQRGKGSTRAFDSC